MVFFLNSGPSVPVAPDIFSNSWKTGFNLGFGIGSVLSQRTILQAYLDYNNFPVDEFAFLEQIGLQNTYSLRGGSVTIISFCSSIKWNFINPVMTGGPFLLGGLGVISRSVGNAMAVSFGSRTVIFDGERETVLSFALGGGADIPIGDNNYAFVEIKYTVGFTDPRTHYLPIKIGFTW